ncbi:unnamed protein product [Lactuca saligna]|uniref:Uncharacterized protein n=1 Tax=Lactuca saligna TaxID=75948 RepID=A0AA36ENS3_LACSI|nr:unnamed protein product [Lactuca saligna]
MSLSMTRVVLYLVRSRSDIELLVSKLAGKPCGVVLVAIFHQSIEAVNNVKAKNEHGKFGTHLISFRGVGYHMAFDVWSEKGSMTLQGHYEYVNCCCYNAHDQFVSPQQLISHVCYDTILLMHLVESVLSKVMEEFENRITSQVELDFRVVFDQELGLILKLRDMMIGWIHDRVSELL